MKKVKLTPFNLTEKMRNKAARIGKKKTGRRDMTAGVNEALDKYELTKKER